MSETITPAADSIAFPELDASEMEAVRKLAEPRAYEDGQIVFRAGEADSDLFIVESGGIEIINPSDDDRQIVVHGRHAQSIHST